MNATQALQAAVARFNEMQAARGDNAGCNPEWRKANAAARAAVKQYASVAGITLAQARKRVEAGGVK